MEAELEMKEEVFDFAEKFKDRMSLSGNEKLMEERTNLDSLKQALKVEVDNRIDTLTAELQRWKSYNEKKDSINEWLKAMEKNLENISVVAVDLETPKQFQVCILLTPLLHMKFIFIC